MKIILVACFAIHFISVSSFANQAQPVPVPEDQSLTPQLNIAGVGAATLGNGPHPINFSDSALMFGASQRLVSQKAIGSAGLGWLTLDDTNLGTDTGLFLNQAFLDYQAEKIEFLMGRSDNPTAHLVDFPTFRGDDLITLLNPMNPFSNGQNAEEHRYSNVVSMTINQNLTYFENFHVQHLIDSANYSSKDQLNAFGATFEYLCPPGMEAFHRVPTVGVSAEHFLINSNSTTGLNQFSVGGVVNLNSSVTDRVDLRVQNILSVGSNLESFQNVTESYQANSNAIAASIRYLASPFGAAGYQLALTAAYKTYAKVELSKSYGGVFTAVKRLGQGFDWVTQYQSIHRGSALAKVQSTGNAFEQIIETGFVFNFDATVNQHLVPRRSMLNQIYQYIPN